MNATIESKRGKTLARAIRILRTLETGARLTVNQLADTNACCTRTIRRDLCALQEAGEPLMYQPSTSDQRRGIWWREPC